MALVALEPTATRPGFDPGYGIDRQTEPAIY